MNSPRLRASDRERSNEVSEAAASRLNTKRKPRRIRVRDAIRNCTMALLLSLSWAFVMKSDNFPGTSSQTVDLDFVSSEPLNFRPSNDVLRTEVSYDELWLAERSRPNDDASQLKKVEPTRKRREQPQSMEALELKKNANATIAGSMQSREQGSPITKAPQPKNVTATLIEQKHGVQTSMNASTATTKQISSNTTPQVMDATATVTTRFTNNEEESTSNNTTPQLSNAVSLATKEVSINEKARKPNNDPQIQNASAAVTRSPNSTEGGRPKNGRENKDSNRVSKVVHIVYTRFMQHQPELIELGLARLKLLQDFFINSLANQSTDNFLLVIRIDPHLNEELLLKPLIETLHSSTLGERALGLATNSNPESQYYDILSRLVPSSITVKPQRGINNTDESAEHIFWKGGPNGTSTDWAMKYLKGVAADPLQVILETRLDADDGLSRFYLQRVQEKATMHLLPYQPSFKENYAIPTDPSWPWKIWCSGQFLEWQVVSPWKTESEQFLDSDTGSLIALENAGCLSAGITLGYWAPRLVRNNFGDSEVLLLPPPKEQGVLSIKSHHSLSGKVASCDRIRIRREQGLSKNRGPILFCISYSKLNPSVLRARTPTSAGMLNILWDVDPNMTMPVSQATSKREQTHREHAEWNMQYRRIASLQKKEQEQFWKDSFHFFGFSKSQARELRQCLQSHMKGIAEDNLKGQCTVGHSCKDWSFNFLTGIVSNSENKAQSSPQQ